MDNQAKATFTCKKCGGVYRYEDGYKRNATLCGCCINKPFEAKATPIAEEMITIYVNEYSKLKRSNEALLEALKIAENLLIETCPSDGKIMKQIRKAISQAEGK